MNRAFIFVSSDRDAPVHYRFPSLWASRSRAVTPFFLSEPVISTQGSLPHLVLYRLGHNASLPSSPAPTPDDIRRWRDYSTIKRLSGRPLHVFTILDPTGLVGSSRNLDTYFNLFAPLLLESEIHFGTWDVTPSDQTYVSAEAESLGLDTSLPFAIKDMWNARLAQSYAQTLFEPTNPDMDYCFLTADSVVFGHLPQVLLELTGHEGLSFTRLIPNATDTTSDLPIKWLTNNPSLARYYWGDEIASKAQQIDVNNITNSPAGQHQVVVLDDRDSQMSDELLHAMVSEGESQIYWLNPFNHRGHLISHHV